MKTKFYRRVGGKHVKFNISKSGVSASIKLGNVTINPQRNRITYNTPIKGLSLTEKLYEEPKEQQTTRAEISKAKEKRILKGIAACKGDLLTLKESVERGGLTQLLASINAILSQYDKGVMIDETATKSELISLVSQIKSLPSDVMITESVYSTLNSQIDMMELIEKYADKIQRRTC